MQLKLKEGVFGFVYNFEDGDVVEIFTEELTSKEIQLMSKVIGDDVYMILDNDDLNLIFEDSIEDEVELEDMGLTEVVEFVK